MGDFTDVGIGVVDGDRVVKVSVSSAHSINGASRDKHSPQQQPGERTTGRVVRFATTKTTSGDSHGSQKHAKVSSSSSRSRSASPDQDRERDRDRKRRATDDHHTCKPEKIHKNDRKERLRSRKIDRQRETERSRDRERESERERERERVRERRKERRESDREREWERERLGGSDVSKEPTAPAVAKHGAEEGREIVRRSSGRIISTPRNNTGDAARPSRLLGADEMDNLEGGTVFTPSNKRKQGSLVFTRVFRVAETAVRDVSTVVRHNSVFVFAMQKLWTSICPAGLDVMFEENKMRVQPSPWFMKSVINGVWRDECERMYESLLLVGYAVVTYGPRAELNGEVCPHVIEPSDYTLEFTIDQYGTRHYVARPHTDRIPSADDGNGTWFEAADVFVVNEPSLEGDILSLGRECLENVVFLQQMMTNYQLLDHSRANVPIVIQNPASWEATVPPWSTGGNGLGAFLGATRRRDGAQPTSEAVAESIDTAMLQYRAAIQTNNDAVRRAVETAYVDGTTKARVTAMRTVDSETGTVESVTPETMWQRSVLMLPPATTLGRFDVPEPSTHFDTVLRMKQAEICATIGVPPELLSGSGHGKANIASSMASQEHLRSAVMRWRNIIEGFAVKIYWRIYGEFHLKNLAAGEAERGVKLTPDAGVSALRSMAVTFRFRSNRLDFHGAMEMFQRGFLKGDAVARIAADEYGIPPQDLIVPVASQAPTNAPPKTTTTTTAAAKPPRRDGRLGDIAPDDIASVGYVNASRKPPPVRSLDI